MEDVLRIGEYGQGFGFTQLALGFASVSTSTFHFVQKLARRMSHMGEQVNEMNLSSTMRSTTVVASG